MKDSKERQCEEMKKDEMKRKRAEKDCSCQTVGNFCSLMPSPDHRPILCISIETESSKQWTMCIDSQMSPINILKC